jgi:hypothetical protein
MILEAFAEYLHAADPTRPATDILAQWLVERLSSPASNNVDRVLQCEMSISRLPGKRSHRRTNRAQEEYTSYTFKGTSKSGER